MIDHQNDKNITTETIAHKDDESEDLSKWTYLRKTLTNSEIISEHPTNDIITITLKIIKIVLTAHF